MGLIKFFCVFALALGLGAAPALAGGGGGGHGDSGGHGGGEKKSSSGKNVNSAQGAKILSSDEGGMQYVRISPLILPLIGDNGVEQIVSLVIILEVTTKDVATEVITMSPKLNDAYLTDLYGTIDRRERMKNGLLDVSYLKNRLTKLTNEIMGPDKVKGILIQGITQRPA